MNIAIERNWEKKDAIIARLERNLANKKYALDLIDNTVGGLQEQKYYEYALYEYKIAKKDLENAKK